MIRKRQKDHILDVEGTMSELLVKIQCCTPRKWQLKAMIPEVLAEPIGLTLLRDEEGNEIRSQFMKQEPF